MANLLDTIRNNTQSVSTPQGMTDESQKLGTLLRARSGKAVGGPAVGASNLQEQQAVADTNTTLQSQVQPQAQIQNQQLQQQQAGLQQQEQQQVSEINQSKRFDNIQNRLKENEVLSNLERGVKELDANKSIAQMEQIGASLRLQDQQYVDNLEREGNRARLDDSLAYKQQYLNAVFDNGSLLSNNDRMNQAAINNDKRAFAQELSKMSINDAWSMFNAEQAAAKDRAKWAAIGQATTGAVQAYGAATPSAAPAASPAPGASGGYSSIGGVDGDYSQFSGKD